MTTINSIEDLARILKEQPTWADAIRALVLTEDLLDLPARFDRFVQAQGEFNARLDRFVEEQRESNRLANLRMNHMEGRLGNLDGGEYERKGRTRSLARTLASFGFEGAYFALHQGGHVDPRFMSSLSLATNRRDVTQQLTSELLEADVIVANEDNRYAVFEISITADNDDIHRAKARAEILAEITGGEVIPAVITANLNEPQREQAEAEKVSVFVVPYP